MIARSVNFLTVGMRNVPPEVGILTENEAYPLSPVIALGTLRSNACAPYDGFCHGFATATRFD